MAEKIFAISWSRRNPNIYREMFKSSGKNNPQILLITHATEEKEKPTSTYDRMYNFFYPALDLERPNIQLLTRDELRDDKKVEEKLSQSDIIYICPGSISPVINLWKTYNFDCRLKEFLKSGKLLAGISSSAGCLFKSFTTKHNNSYSLKGGLGLVDAHFSCYGQYKESQEYFREMLELIKGYGILLTDNIGVLIEDGKYRIITSNGERYNLVGYNNEVYAIVAHYEEKYNESEKLYYTTQQPEELKKLLKKR